MIENLLFFIIFKFINLVIFIIFYKTLIDLNNRSLVVEHHIGELNRFRFVIQNKLYLIHLIYGEIKSLLLLLALLF